MQVQPIGPVGSLYGLGSQALRESVEKIEHNAEAIASSLINHSEGNPELQQDIVQASLISNAQESANIQIQAKVIKTADEVLGSIINIQS
ncbi:MAG: hypothetical protein ACKOAD_01820 [Gammaproteobacteria bacterium]